MPLTSYKRLGKKQRQRLVRKRVNQILDMNILESRQASIPIFYEKHGGGAKSKEYESDDSNSHHDNIISTEYQNLEDNNESLGVYTVSGTSTSVYTNSPNNHPIDISTLEQSKSFLRDWGKRFNISHVAVTQLLKWLRTNPILIGLPKDARTLFQTPATTLVTKMGTGKFYYFGLRNSLIKICEKYSHYLELCLDFNVDGLPLHKSTKKQFWPILAKVNNIPTENPFLVALYLGEEKPPLDEYFQSFTEELSYLNFELVINDNQVKMTINSFCCDTPARCYIKNVKQHNSYTGCDKCTVMGVRVNRRMTFCNLNASVRTDNSFASKEDTSYHKGDTPLEMLPIGLISNFPIDYMHSVCLGIVRKLLFVWRDEGRAYGIKHFSLVNVKILELKRYWPTDFNRKPRSLTELEHWKATEYRNFLLYVGPIVLKEILPRNIYCNFILLKYGISILLNNNLNELYNNYANKLLRLFVQNCIQIYGREFCVYNTHVLIHLASEARKFGSLNSVNCFPFENFLFKLKRMLRKGNLPLEQVVRRCQELGCASNFCTNNDLQNLSLLSPLGIDYAEQKLQLTENNCSFYAKLYFNGSYLTANDGANCLFLANDNIIKILYFYTNPDFNDSKALFVAGHKLQIIKPFMEYPCSSSLFHFYEVQLIENVNVSYNCKDILYKGVIIPDGKKYIVFPLLHIF